MFGSARNTAVALEKADFTQVELRSSPGSGFRHLFQNQTYPQGPRVMELAHQCAEVTQAVPGKTGLVPFVELDAERNGTYGRPPN